MILNKAVSPKIENEEMKGCIEAKTSRKDWHRGSREEHEASHKWEAQLCHDAILGDFWKDVLV